MKLLAVETISGKPLQTERFRRWIERLVESRGKAFVIENRRELLNQWEEFAKVEFTSCL
jgi:hypothetical protein